MNKLISTKNRVFISLVGPSETGKSQLIYNWLKIGTFQPKYRDATSVAFGHLLIDLSPRTDDRLRYCTNSGSVPSKFYIPERLKHLRTLDDEHTKTLYSPRVPIAFPQLQKPLCSVLPKRVYPFSMRMHSKSTQGKLASHKKTLRGKVSRRSLVTIAKKNNLEAKKKRSVVRKGIATNSRHYTSRH